MSFATLEESVHSGRPIQLYLFMRSSGGNDYYWQYNSSDRDVWYNTLQYKAVPITDDGVRQTGEAASAEFKVTLPILEAFCQDYRAGGAPPSDTIYLRVFRVHANDIIDLDGDIPIVELAQLVWVGTVDGVTQTNDLSADVNCSTLSVSFQRGGLRYTWMKNCPHVLYAPLTCRANKDDFRVDSYVSEISGNFISADDFANVDDGYFDGGYVEYALRTSNYVERRMVLSHTGTTVTLLGTVAGLDVGAPISAYAGCERTVRACIDKFNNYANYGGFPHSPGRNPFDGKPVF